MLNPPTFCWGSKNGTGRDGQKIEPDPKAFARSKAGD